MRILLAALLMTGCTSVSAQDAQTSSANERLSGARYSSPIWLSDDFEGTHTRRYDEQTLVLDMVQTAKGGGLDTSIGYQPPHKPTVGQIHPDHFVCWSYDVELETEGKWWAGPKISVNWIDDPDNIHGMAGWYENYVVETASQTPAELESDLIAWFDTEFIGETEQDGSTYRHLRVAFQDWTQFWAIRQDMRDEGATTLGSILEKWRESGLPGLPYDGSKMNIETYGPTRGRVEIAGFIPADATLAPERPAAPGCHLWTD